MRRRRAHFGTILRLSAFLLAGCLSRQDGTPSIWVRPQDTPAQVTPTPALAEPPAAPPPPTPDLLSDYQARVVVPVTQTSMTLDPAVTRARVEIKPALEPPPLPKPEAPLVGAMRCALEKHPEEARKLLDKYDKGDRELLFALLHLTAGVGKHEIEKLTPEQVDTLLDHLATLWTQLRRKARLSLGHASFCQTIEGYGRYERVSPRHEFQAGCEGRPGERMQVYAEVRNFTSRLVRDQYETVLESTLEIRDAQRRKVVTHHLGRSVDHSHSPRQDYFLNIQLHVPPRLPPGLYTLWVTVRDVTTETQDKVAARQASCSLDFTVSPPGASLKRDPSP